MFLELVIVCGALARSQESNQLTTIPMVVIIKMPVRLVLLLVCLRFNSDRWGSSKQSPHGFLILFYLSLHIYVTTFAPVLKYQHVVVS